MSPPTLLCVDDHEKPLLVSSVTHDLDTGEANIDKKTVVLLKGISSDVATEHDDHGTRKVGMSSVQENGAAKKWVDLPVDDIKHANNLEFLPADSPTTPSSLCVKSNPSDDDHKSFCDSSQKRKRKNKVKGSRNKKKSKRCKTSHDVDGCCIQNGSFLNVGKIPGVKTVGGGTQTNQTGNNGGCPAKVNNATNGTGTSAGMQGNPRGNRGGGSGGDGDGNNPPRELKQLACDGPSTPITISGKQRKPNSADMDVDSKNSSSPDSGMDISGSPPTGTDIPMVTLSPDVKKAEQKPSKPEKKPPEKKPPENIQPSQELLTAWNTRINHYAYKYQTQCKCIRCCWTKLHMSHFLETRKSECDCHNCKIWPRVLDYHKATCINRSCFVCEACRKVEPAPTPVVQHVAVNQQRVQNITTAGSSLDGEEAVIYCDDSLQDANLSHFTEHVDYIFKYQDPNKTVGEGGHGTVHDIVLNPRFKDQYPGFPPQDIVVKKTTLGDDEKEVLKAIACHPNFVKTYLVVNKTEVSRKEYKHRIFMQKCDMSLKEYIDKKWEKLETLDKYEAMHYWTQVLDAVAYLHTRRIPIIHKDIKPGNVLLTFETNFIRAMLADFDAVKLLHNDYTQPGLTPEGTKNYIAPEVWRCQAHGRPADIYSMGKFLLELLCRNERMNTELALKKLKKIDNDLGVLIEQCLKITPEDRPTAVQLLNSEAVKKYMSKDVSMSQPGKA